MSSVVTNSSRRMTASGIVSMISSDSVIEVSIRSSRACVDGSVYA